MSCGNLAVKDGPWNEEVLPQNLYVHRRGREWIPQWQRIQKVSILLWHSGKLLISLKSRAVFLNRWVNTLVGRGHFLLCHQNLCYCSKIIINGLQIILFCGSPITKFLNVFFGWFAPFGYYIFLFFFSSNEPKLGAGIDPGMALNVDHFHLVF
jgi:hypothetical protein